MLVAKVGAAVVCPSCQTLYGESAVTANVAFPIFVFEGNDLSLFDSFESLVAGLEGIDVEDGVYQAYDSHGKEVGLEARGVSRGRFVVEIGNVVVGRVAEAPNLEQFESKLLSYLTASGKGPSQNLSFEELVHACIKCARWRNEDV